VNCQSCNKPATVHLTDIVNGKKKEIHLCQECAEKQELLKQQELNLSAILQTVIGQHLQPTDELSRLTCPACGIKYMEFKAGGRLGCPHDY
jgi:protein arginine kinase activator